MVAYVHNHLTETFQQTKLVAIGKVQKQRQNWIYKFNPILS